MSEHGNWFRRLVARTNSATNSEGAKRTRKTLIVLGAVGLAIGVGLIIAGIVSFVSLIPSTELNSARGRLIAGPVLVIVGGIIAGLGSMSLWAGISIVIAGVGSNFVDSTDRCPKCGDLTTADESFCDKCGTPLLRKTLCECGKQNELDSQFCKDCGKKLR